MDGDLNYRDTSAMLVAIKPDIPVYALRLHELRSAAENLTSLFPGDVLYAVKANPNADILHALYAGGIRHFDVASLKEARLVAHHYPAAHSYFMHPVKSVTAIREAAHKMGITHFVVDHADELAKVIIHTMPHKPVIIIRLAMPQGMAVYDLSGKFGCNHADAIALARSAAAEGLAVGFSFHVGSQCLNPAAYYHALEVVADVVRASNIHPELIDVGGGLPVMYTNTHLPPLEQYIDAIKSGLTQVPLHHPTRLLTEPGRALSAIGASLFVKVELRRGNLLYLNDGLYGGMSELRFTGLDVPMRVWRVNGAASILTSPHEDYRFCGPTCDSADMLDGPFSLPNDIRIGDYIEFGQMGAYSLSLRSDFNGFQHAMLVTVNDAAFLP